MNDAASRLTVTASGSSFVLVGELDAHTAPILEDALGAHDAVGRNVELDMSEVGFVDSSGLRSIVEAHTAVANAGHSLTIANPSRAVERLIEIAGLADHLTVVTST